VRFSLDEDLPPRMAEIARGLGLDVISVHERGQQGLPDAEVLRLAALERRCLVTRNRDDFIELTNRFLENEWPHAGVLIVPRSLPNNDFAGLARALVAYSEHHPGEIESYTLDFLAAQRPSG
jgi:predicted nuclease of predicted toxin-antitoxin system